MKILVVDNYDSFAYNLVQYVGEVVTDPEWDVVESPSAGDVLVRRNDAVTPADIHEMDPDGIVVSPGPGTPADAGVSTAVFSDLEYPTLGVCLGHQALCAAHGATVGHAEAVVHGKPSTVEHDGCGLYAGLPERFEVGRYHSLAVARADLPDVLTETAWTAGDAGTSHREGRVVMGVRHREKPHFGVQFHPESVLTNAGKRLLATFCDTCQSISTT